MISYHIGLLFSMDRLVHILLFGNDECIIVGYFCPHFRFDAGLFWGKGFILWIYNFYQYVWHCFLFTTSLKLFVRK